MRPRQQPRRGRGVGTLAAAAGGPSDVMVLDFDGVICDSEREVSTSGYEACQQYWPQLFGAVGDAELQRIMAGLRRVRPRLIKGYEALVMARLILEDERCSSAELGQLCFLSGLMPQLTCGGSLRGHCSRACIPLSPLPAAAACSLVPSHPPPLQQRAAHTGRLGAAAGGHGAAVGREPRGAGGGV